MTTRNEILDEIYAAREELLAQHDGDVHAYVAAARQRALESGRQISSPKKHRETENGTEKTDVSRAGGTASRSPEGTAS